MSQPADDRAFVREVTVLYASQTGNGRALAAELRRRLEDRRFRVTLASMSEYPPERLVSVDYLLAITSTYGEGGPPERAASFFEFLHGKEAPGLEGLRFSVLALGDVTYDRFCQAGRDLDERLEELGAVRLHPRSDCDVEFHDPAEAWMEGVLAALCRETGPSRVVGGAPARVGAPGAATAVTGPPRYDRRHPFPAEVLRNVNLNRPGSDEETRHLALSIAGSGLQYEPGDSLGIFPENPPRLVYELLAEMRWNPEEPVPVGGEYVPLREALLRHYEITALSKPLIGRLARSAPSRLKELLAPGRDEAQRTYIAGRDLLDLVRDFSLAGAPASEFVRRLRRMPPRLYSIASSRRACPDEVHAAVAVIRYHVHGREREGVFSVQCAERVHPGGRLPVYVHANPDFRMPADPDVALIMIGTGTGVAPFRAFLQDREEGGAAGKTWLLFGDRRSRTDFLYQAEWERWLRRGLLTRMDTAFSRDSDRKRYVQHRMIENGRELFAWLEEGAHLYVCGDQKRMAPNVHAALGSIVERAGGRTPAQAQQYVADLIQQNRYQSDVY